MSKGFSLVEVLVSLLLLSLILFGLDAMQIYAIKQSQIAYLFTTAMNQVNNFSERMAALRQDDAIQSQLAIWNQENQQLLPEGFGTVRKEDNKYVIELFWGHRLSSCDKTIIEESGCLQAEVYPA